MASLSAKDFLACCGSSKFASEMAKVAPFSSSSEAVEASRTIWWNKVDIPGWLEAFSAHPRIGDVEALKRVVPTAEWSKGEQSEALKSANNSVMQELAEWNRQYAAKFGFVFLICASGKSSSEILSNLKERFASRPIDELQVAAAEQQKITEIRLGKLFAERESSDQQVGKIGGLLGIVQTDRAVMSTPDPSTHLVSTPHSLLRPPITTHVLDVSRGRPGAGIEVALDVWKGYSTNDESGEWTNIGSSLTDSDGRSGPLMAPSNSVSAGRYKLTFNTGKYYSNLSNSGERSDLGGGSFYPYISVVFEIKPAQVSEHFHVPVLLSPFSYTTYRGS